MTGGSRRIRKLIYTNDHTITRFHTQLKFISATCDLFLEEAGCDRLIGTAQIVDLSDQLYGTLLKFIRKRLYIVAPSKWILPYSRYPIRKPPPVAYVTPA